MKRTAMSHHAKVSILSNEMVRRLDKTDPNRNDQLDICNVIENYTRELKISKFGFRRLSK